MEVIGKYGIRAKVLKKSESSVTGLVFKTFEVEYPRIILAELNTHRMLSKNSASSRAIPFPKMLKQLNARPVRFGQANPGMQDKGGDYSVPLAYYDDPDYFGEMVLIKYADTPQDAWDRAKGYAVEAANHFYQAKYHKQVYNRLVEPFQMMKTVISGTEWANFFWLRNHEAADPTIAELARVMWEADEGTEAQVLQPGEWHLPYVTTLVSSDGSGAYYYLDDNDVGTAGHIPLEDAIKVSCARCAAVSFRNVDYGIEKSREVYERLVGDERKHASAFEHCATPMKAYSHGEPKGFGLYDYVNLPGDPRYWEEGITHMDRQGNLWSGNLKGWRQYRKLIPGENYVGEH